MMFSKMIGKIDFVALLICFNSETLPSMKQRKSENPFYTKIAQSAVAGFVIGRLTFS